MVRFLIISIGLLTMTGAALAATGEYQSTKNGKTMVWNSAPKPGDVATWNGDRDREGYGSGFGTLTWYTNQGATKSTVYGIYYGNMVHGKFEGPVNVHVKNKTAHAIFTDGVRTSRWAGGPAPSFKVEQKPVELIPAPTPVKEEIVSRPIPKLEATPNPKPPKPERTPAPVVQKAKPEATPMPPAPVVAEKREEPFPQDTPVERSEPPVEKPAPPATSTPSPRPSKKPPAVPPDQKVRDKYDDSLRALVGPPSSLRANSVPTAQAKAKPAASAAPSAAKPVTMATPRAAELAEEDVIELADAEALAQGYDLSNYLSPKLDYSKAKERWTVFYDAKTGEPNDPSKSLIVAVEDKTKKAFVTNRK